MILQLFMIYLFTNYRVNSQLNFLPFQIVFYLCSQYQWHFYRVGGWGWAGSHEVAGKGSVFTKISQMASIGAIFTSTYHSKQLNPWQNSPASCVVKYSQLSAFQGDMQPFEGHPNTHGHLTGLRNKPQQKQPRQLSASIPACIVSQRLQLSFNGEKCVLMLCARKVAFVKSGHIYPSCEIHK